MMLGLQLREERLNTTYREAVAQALGVCLTMCLTMGCTGQSSEPALATTMSVRDAAGVAARSDTLSAENVVQM